MAAAVLSGSAGTSTPPMVCRSSARLKRCCFMARLSLLTLLTRPPSASSKNTMAILRPRASPSYMRSSLPARVLFSAMYRVTEGLQESLYMKPFLKMDFM